MYVFSEKGLEQTKNNTSYDRSNLEVDMTDFKVGDVVKLKSGGPEMTVEGVTDDGQKAICTWFAGNKPDRKAFPFGALREIGKSTGHVGVVRN